MFSGAVSATEHSEPGATCPMVVQRSSEGTRSINRAALMFLPKTPGAQNGHLKSIEFCLRGSHKKA